MDERSLLLLGMLKTQRQHGYQINEFLEKNLSRVIDMKRSTAYTLLDRLYEQGYVERSIEQQGNRPPRKVYTLTSLGDEASTRLLRENITQTQTQTMPFEIGLIFLDYLSKDELLGLLRNRLRRLEQQSGVYTQTSSLGFGAGVDMALAHRAAMLQAERDWLTQTIDQLATPPTPL